MSKFLILIGLVAGAFVVLQAGYNIERIPLHLVLFGLATTGVVWALAKI